MNARGTFRSLAGTLYFWVALAILFGGALGYAAPSVGAKLQPVAEAFIALIRMLIGPIIFCTIALGVSGSRDLKKAGRVGAKAILYFEVLSTVALAIGLGIANWFKPGASFGAHLSQFSTTPAQSSVEAYAKQAADFSVWEIARHAIPTSFVGAFASENLLQVILIGVLFGGALVVIGDRREPARKVLVSVSEAFFAMISGVMKLAPLGAGAAMAYTVGRYGAHSLGPLVKLMACFYASCMLFAVGVLGLVAWACGFNILRLFVYLRSELLLVLGTSSSESALSPLIKKLEALGCSQSTVGLVVPAGYSFNLDGTNIYLSLAALFVAQALGIDLSFADQIAIMSVAMLTSKGASGVTGAGFVALAATLAVVPKVPVAGLALILGVDRFMSEARALTNFIGNSVAALAIARWEGELTASDLRAALVSKNLP